MNVMHVTKSDTMPPRRVVETPHAERLTTKHRDQMKQLAPKKSVAWVGNNTGKISTLDMLSKWSSAAQT